MGFPRRPLGRGDRVLNVKTADPVQLLTSFSENLYRRWYENIARQTIVKQALTVLPSSNFLGSLSMLVSSASCGWETTRFA